MKKPISFGKLDVQAVSSLKEATGRPEEEAPFRILLMGNFSGRRGSKKTALSGPAMLHPIQVDRDDLDEVMAKLHVAVELPLFGEKRQPVGITFSELDDFHPDRLFDRLELFQALKDTRRGFKDPAWAKAFAGGPSREEGGVQGGQGREGSIVEDVSRQSAGNLLDEIIEGSEGGVGQSRKPSASPTSAWDAFLQEIVAPHLSPDIKPEQQEMVAVTEAAMTELMSAIIHHPDFQEMEANWRGLSFLTSRLETDEMLRIYVLDISKDRLHQDLCSQDDLTAAALYGLLVRDTEENEAEPWAVVAGIYTFDESAEDAELLGRLSKIAARARAPFVSAADPRLLGCESLSKTPDPRDWKNRAHGEGSASWEALRHLPEAAYIGLALPRFLLRLPYGAKTEPIDCFDFEEMTDLPEHQSYLWGNPAFACVYLLAQAFTDDGWGLEPGSIQDIEDLPLHVFKREGETVSKPCAEVTLTYEAAEAILDAGLMPLLSLKNQDAVRLARFQAISDPPGPLKGRWSAQ